MIPVGVKKTHIARKGHKTVAKTPAPQFQCCRWRGGAGGSKKNTHSCQWPSVARAPTLKLGEGGGMKVQALSLQMGVFFTPTGMKK